MWRKDAFLLLSVTLASAVLCPNCATIITRSKQEIPVTSTPVGAKVIVNGIEQGQTPLEIRLTRKRKGQVIRIESPGYNPLEIRPKRIMSAGPIIGNFLIGVILGAVPAAGYAVEHELDADVSTKAYLIWAGTAAAICGLLTAIDAGAKGYVLRPTELAVTLTKAGGTPRLDITVIGAEDFQNITWIRVRRD